MGPAPVCSLAFTHMASFPPLGLHTPGALGQRRDEGECGGMRSSVPYSRGPFGSHLVSFVNALFFFKSKKQSLKT